MKTIEAKWVKEIIFDVDLSCPYCDYYYDWHELKIGMGDNYTGNIKCELCGKKFKVSIEGEIK
jgi:uncharacterized Zn-finger protein